jgi:predicted dinucleotide-binding enzyme
MAKDFHQPIMESTVDRSDISRSDGETGARSVRIGVIGTGNMGRALGLGWARAGHEVLFGSRDIGKAQAVAAGGSRSAQVGDYDTAADFGEVVLYTVRGVSPSTVLRQPQFLSGKVVIDCNNSDIVGLDVPHPEPGRHGLRFITATPSLAERLAADVAGARVVKAFNTISATVIALGFERLRPHRVSVFLCSDDAQAKAVVGTLAEQLGFIVVDSGPLERARLVENVADFIRFQILEMELGPFATISVNLLPRPQ